jgi:hypothetical protein
MLLNHGVEKLKNFSDTTPNFPDPLGIGHAPTPRLPSSSDANACASPFATRAVLGS